MHLPLFLCLDESFWKRAEEEQKNRRQNKRKQQPRLIEPLINLGGGY